MDVFDRHVHAAAVAGGADCVITSDASFTGLPLEVRDELSYEIYTPDEFFVLVDDSSPSTVCATLRYQLNYWKQQPGATKDPSTALVDANCPDFAARVKAHCQRIAIAG